jgi:arylsulfatase A-like enzyme
VFGCGDSATQSQRVDRWVIAGPGSSEGGVGEAWCEVGDEMRPAVGCPRVILTKPLGETVATPTGASRRYWTSSPNRRGPVLLERFYRFDSTGPLSHLEPLVAPQFLAEMEVGFPIGAVPSGEKTQVKIKAYALPPAEQQFETPTLRIPPDAVLAGGIGLSPQSLGPGRPPVRFRLSARTRSKETVLLDEMLDPASERARSWVDYRIDLGALADQQVRFIAKTRAIAPKGDDPILALPLWSGACILVPRRAERAPNVVLISLDTLRADHVGTYGSELATTPHIDRLADEGVVFENVVAPWPSTTASHMSMLTGVYPAVHRISGPTHILSHQIETLAEILVRHGYQTAGITENGMIAAKSGFARGFGFYREFKNWNPASSEGHVREGVDVALAWLGKHREERFFLFLHTYQPHNPYSPPEGFDIFTDPASAAEKPQSERNRLAYAGDILYTDDQIGRLLDGLAEQGLADETVVVVTSDHGEAFGEHGVAGHAWYLIEEVLSVPLIVRAPGAIPAGVRMSTPVSLVDVTPTILQLAGVPPPGQLQGLSLLPLIADEEASPFRDRVLFTQRGHDRLASFAMRRGKDKWLFQSGQGPEVYDLEADPNERQPRTDPALVAEGQRLLDRFKESSKAARSGVKEPAGHLPLDPEVEDKLRRLGYIE